MNNAVKALMMAATVFLAVLLLATFVRVFKVGASLDETYDLKQAERQLNLFNSQFEVYDRNNNTIMDILSAVNAAYNVNVDYNYDAAKTVQVIVRIGTSTFELPTAKDPYQKTLKRNNILDKDKKIISIYDLVDKTLGGDDGLGVKVDSTHHNDNDKLTTTRLAAKLPKYKDDEVTLATDKDGNQLYRENVTVYKYLFKCTGEDGQSGISYHSALGRVIKVEFEAFYNERDWE